MERCQERMAAYRASGQTAKARAEANDVALRAIARWRAHSRRWRALGLTLPAAKARLLGARQRLRERMTTARQLRFEPECSVASHVPRPVSG